VVISKENAPHYTWGADCDGWRLVDTPGLSIIHERMPPNTQEKRHYHRVAHQFFFVLQGQLCLELDGTTHLLMPGQGIEVALGLAHQAINTSEAAVEFIVTSAPSTAGDRIEV
jgi:mannose-6-phosphate isomerase-like protein (cupin superfamily)